MTEPTTVPAVPATRNGAGSGPRRTGVVSFVGGGPGDPGLLTVRAVKLLGEADVVVVDVLDRTEILARYTRPGVTVVPGGRDGDDGPLAGAERARVVVSAAADGSRVVRIVDGDSTTFSTIVDEVAACRRAGIDIEIVPGVPISTAVPAYAGVPITPGGATSAVHTVWAHERGEAALTPGAAPSTDSVIVLGEPHEIAAAAVRLVAEGWAADCPSLIVSNGTTLAQHSKVMTLDQVPSALSSAEPPVTLVVGSPVAHRDSLAWFETRPLFGWRVLLPRTKEQSSMLVDRLSEYGARAEIVPTISIEEPRTPAHMDRAVRGLVTGRYEWIGFTSANAVRGVRERLEALGLDARALSGLRVAAVGGVTADALRDWGIEPDLVPEGEQSARGLLAEWPAYDEQLDPINRILLPRADIATEILVAGLQELGWEVDDVTAYRTVRAAPPPAPVREAIKTGAFDAVVFTSSSTVRNLIGIAGKPHAATVIACIGPATARTAEEHGLRVDVIPAEPSGPALVDALADHGVDLRRAALEAGKEPVRPSQRRVVARRRAR
ncbi:MAG: uroporphyrinogen-III synthase [Kineosporiaceae bacterium]